MIAAAHRSRFAKRASFAFRETTRGIEPRDAEIFAATCVRDTDLYFHNLSRRHDVFVGSKECFGAVYAPPRQPVESHSGVSAPSMTPSLHTSPKTPPAVTCAPAPGPRMMSGVDSISAE